MKKNVGPHNVLRGMSEANIKALFFIDGNLVRDKREISNGFYKFFSSIARKLNVKPNSSRPAGAVS